MIRFSTSTEGLQPSDLDGGFFEGWPNPPTPVTHLAILRGSSHVALARHADSGQVVGFATAISDGVLSAFIPLLEVLPSYRGRGIGSDLVRHLLEEIGPLYAVDAICDPDLQPFYTHLGMRPGHGVMLRTYERQSGPGPSSGTRPVDT